MKKVPVLISLLSLTALLFGCADKNTAANADLSTAANTAPSQEAVLSPSLGSAGETPPSPKGLKGQITDQSFPVNLDGWGDVTFASFLPQQEAKGDGDVSFKLLKNGEDIYDFPGVTKDNRCPGESFDQVSAVAFKDYNGDGKTDIILILAYSPETDPGKSIQKVRLYTQAGNSKKFTYDQYLAERLTKDGCSTIQTVMEDIGENSNYQEALNEPKNGAVDQQLKVIADHRKLWAVPAEGLTSDYSYAVTDLDQNGHLELIVSITQGSAHYTDSTYYEVNKTFDNLVPCVQTKKEGDPQGRLGLTVPVYCDPKAGLYHYILTSGITAGTSAFEAKSSLTLTNGAIHIKPLAARTEDNSGQTGSGPAVTFQDAEGKSITQDEYLTAADSLYSGLTKKQADIDWISGLSSDGTDPLQTDKSLLEEKLAASYSGFSIR